MRNLRACVNLCGNPNLRRVRPESPRRPPRHQTRLTGLFPHRRKRVLRRAVDAGRAVDVAGVRRVGLEVVDLRLRGNQEVMNRVDGVGVAPDSMGARTLKVREGRRTRTNEWTIQCVAVSPSLRGRGASNASTMPTQRRRGRGERTKDAARSGKSRADSIAPKFTALTTSSLNLPVIEVSMTVPAFGGRVDGVRWARAASIA